MDQSRTSDSVTFVRWVGVGVPLLSGATLVIAVLLHLGFGISIAGLKLPLIMFLSWQLAAYLLMFWLRMRFKRDLRPATLLGGVYCLGAGVLAIYFAREWGLTSRESADFDMMAYPICATLATGISVFVVSRFSSNRD